MLLSSSPLPTDRFLLLTGKLYSLHLASPHTLGSEGTEGDVSVICDMGGAEGKHGGGAGIVCQIFIGHAKFNFSESLGSFLLSSNSRIND